MDLKYKDVLKSIRDGKCPLCGSKDITYDNFDDADIEDHESLLWGVHCGCCWAVWHERFIFTGAYEVILDGEDELKIEDDLSRIDKVPDILMAVLENKSILPTLIGIDSNFDVLIEKALKE